MLEKIFPLRPRASRERSKRAGDRQSRFPGWWGILGVLVALGSPARAGEAPAHSGATVLLYHRVGDDRHPSTNVSSEAFRTQLTWLREAGYTVVPTAALEADRTRGDPLPPRSVVIQFDDGYRSVYENAYPILRELGYPFTVFLPTEALDAGYADYLTWTMAAEMAAHGATYGTHGQKHERLGLPEAGEGETAYRARVRRELVGAASRLRARGFEPRWVAYPYGEYNPTVLAEAREAGYHLGFSQDPGAVGPASDPFCLPRFAVVGTLAGPDTFRERLRYAPLALDRLSPAPGVLPRPSPEVYGATVVDPTRYRPGVVNLFVSELGPLDATFDPVTGRVEARSPTPLSRRLNRVLISVEEKTTGRWALASWLILRAAEPLSR